MNNTFRNMVNFLSVLFLILTINLRKDEGSSHFGKDEACYSFAEGTVYPTGLKHAEHQL